MVSIMADDNPDGSGTESGSNTNHDGRNFGRDDDSKGPDGEEHRTARAPWKNTTQSYLDSITEPVAHLMKSHNQAAIDAVLAAAKKHFHAASYLPATPDYISGLSAVVNQLSTQPSLSRPRDFAELDTPASAHSPELESPGTYFESTEREVTSFKDLNEAISDLIDKTPELPLVWRGVSNANWGLYSSLYRHLVDKNGVKLPQDNPRGKQPYPDEDQMVAAEKEILRLARTDWRFDDLSALETFARLQHVGGPTRLIDVTKNPYVGAWFAVEHNERHEDKDGRLFALATTPVHKKGSPEPRDSTVHLDSLGAGREPFWHHLIDNGSRQGLDWGTGARRRLWVPPTYDPRISAQNAAFIFDGVPMTSARTAPYFKIDNSKYWKRADLLAASSIYTKMSSATRKPQPNAPNFAPTFSFRITAAAKRDIREVMESRFGYRTSYIYPDMQALADHLKKQPLATLPDYL